MNAVYMGSLYLFSCIRNDILAVVYVLLRYYSARHEEQRGSFFVARQARLSGHDLSFLN